MILITKETDCLRRCGTYVRDGDVGVPYAVDVGGGDDVADAAALGVGGGQITNLRAALPRESLVADVLRGDGDGGGGEDVDFRGEDGEGVRRGVVGVDANELRPLEAFEVRHLFQC